MVHLKDLVFVIICSLILNNVKLSILFSTGSTSSYKEIEQEIRAKVSNLDSAKKEEKLIEIAAQEKYDHQRTKEERLEFKKDAEENLKRAESAENAKDLNAIPMEVLQMRDAIEKRIDWVYGGTGKPAEKGYMAALEDALTSNEKSIITNLRIKEFRSVIQETGFEDMENFVDIMKVLYRDFSFGQAHKITGSNIKLPSHEDVERITKILGAAGVRLDLPNIKALQAFLKPCKEMGKRAPGEDLRCLIFKTTHQRHAELFKPEAKILKEDIFCAFPEIKPLQAAWVSYVDKNQKKVYMIQVEFETAKDASNGYHNNHGWFKTFKVKPEQSPCYDASADTVIEEIASTTVAANSG